MRFYLLRGTCLAAVLISPSIVFAQTATGSISGMVKDASGAVVPGAGVTITNVDTGIGRSVVTDAAGRYNASGLIPAHYEAQAQMSGFETAVRRGIQLTVGANLEIDLVLQVGQVTEKTVVTAEAPLVETVTNTLSGLVDDKTIRELPLNGRSFDYLISLEPGTHWFRTGGHTATGGLMSQYFTVGGSRALSNLYLMDGTELLGAGGQSTLPGGVLGKNMGVDAIQEFTVLVGNYGAAYGKRSGGIVNTVTRSGTNQIHGSVFEFLRNSALDARNFFDPTRQPPPFRRNEFGGTLGGPLRRDKAFFFGAYEGLREGLGLTNIATVPDDNARRGLLPDPQRPGQSLNIGVAPNVRPFLVLFGPVNGRIFGDGTAQSINSPTQISSQDFFLARVDHNLSEKDSLFARYAFTKASLNAPALNSLFTGISTSGNQSLALEERRAYATTVNVLRFAFGRARATNNSFPLISLDPSLVFFPGASTIGSITFGTSGSNAGGALTATGNSTIGRWLVLNQFEGTDQVSRFVGRHSLQFGVSVHRIQHNENWQGNPKGSFTFPSLQTFLTGQPSLFSGPPPAGADSTKAYRQIYFAGFVQDDFKIRPNLTLNLGLRYELMTVPVEASGNRISNYHVNLVGGVPIFDTNPTVGSPFFQGSHKEWSPRLGFVWDPFRDGKMVFRSGFGIFYDQIVSEFRFFTPGNPPFWGALQLTNPPFPTGFAGGTIQTAKQTPSSVDFHLNVPRKLQWNFSVQRELSSNTVFNIAYMGAHSYHLTRVADANTPLPTLSGGTKFYPANAPRRNSALGSSSFVSTDANSFYHGLQMDITQRLSRGLRAKASYSYSKNIDEASSVTGQEALGSPATPQDPENIRGERGLSAFDVRHNIVTNFTYDFPGSQLRGAWGKLAGGWQVGGIVSANSGEPFTALTGFNSSRNQFTSLADRPNLRSGASNNPVLGGPRLYFDPTAFAIPVPGFYGNLGRNTITGPGLVNVDFSVMKVTPMSERWKAEFRAEFFNFFNHASFGLPSNPVFNTNRTVRGAAGAITATTTTSRQIQFGLKLSF